MTRPLAGFQKAKTAFVGKLTYPKKKAPDAYRIIVLGGSAARGAGVQADQTFSWLLEENLSKANPPLKPEVLNAGVNGYHLIQMADYLEIYLLLYHPDLVIAYSGAFDASDQAIDPGKPIEAFDVRKERQPSTSLKIVDEIRKLLDSLESYYLLTRLVLPLRDRAPDVITDSSTLKDKRSAGLMRIRLLCEMIGAEFMIAEPVTRPNGKDTLAVPGWNRDREWEGYFTPLYEPFLQSGFAPSELFFDEVHLSKQGHKFVAQELTRSILGLNLIEREYEDRKNSD